MYFLPEDLHLLSDSILLLEVVDATCHGIKLLRQFVLIKVELDPIGQLSAHLKAILLPQSIRRVELLSTVDVCVLRVLLQRHHGQNLIVIGDARVRDRGASL